MRSSSSVSLKLESSSSCVLIWSHSIVVNIGACHASVESSILSGTAKFSRCCSQRPCYKFRVEALISQDSRFNWHRVTSVGLRPFFANCFAPFVYRSGHPPFTQVRAVRFCYGAPCFKEICMPMYETTVKTPEGEKKDRVYAQNAKEAKQLFEQRYGPRNVPYIPHMIAS